MQEQLQALRNYFDTGATRSYAFRLQQLQKLKQAIEAHEQAIYDALYVDLKKSKEECWVTENGIVLTELRYAINELKVWMEPQRVRTNLLNLPSSSRIVSEPLGVVLIIAPWNYPFQLLINPLIGAIAAGNCVVLKPSEHAPATEKVMQQIIESVFDKNYICYVQGDGAKVVPEMMQSFAFDHVFYTGSTAVGRIIYQLAADKLVPVTLELGGKSPVVVEADADIAVTARRIAVAKFSNAGQMCVTADYVLVHTSKKQALIEALKKTIHDFFGDDPSQSSNYGKIINARQFQRIQQYLQQGRVLVGGQTHTDSLYIAPTLMDEVSLDAPVMQEEIFGPVLPIISFETKEEALQIIARNKNPLAFYVFTASKENEQWWMDRVSFGGGCV
ncbi:MAG: hypothetical protein RIR90_340, partial [Bacteroidota bacterium]